MEALVAAIGRLVREMPRNPTVLEVDKELKAALSNRVAVTLTNPVAATDCPKCSERRETQRAKMQRYRNKA